VTFQEGLVASPTVLEPQEVPVDARGAAGLLFQLGVVAAELLAHPPEVFAFSLKFLLWLGGVNELPPHTPEVDCKPLSLSLGVEFQVKLGEAFEGAVFQLAELLVAEVLLSPVGDATELEPQALGVGFVELLLFESEFHVWAEVLLVVFQLCVAAELLANPPVAEVGVFPQVELGEGSPAGGVVVLFQLGVALLAPELFQLGVVLAPVLFAPELFQLGVVAAEPPQPPVVFSFSLECQFLLLVPPELLPHPVVACGFFSLGVDQFCVAGVELEVEVEADRLGEPTPEDLLAGLFHMLADTPLSVLPFLQSFGLEFVFLFLQSLAPTTPFPFSQFFAVEFLFPFSQSLPTDELPFPQPFAPVFPLLQSFEAKAPFPQSLAPVPLSQPPFWLCIELLLESQLPLPLFEGLLHVNEK
jgi:hypothetical protein